MIGGTIKTGNTGVYNTGTYIMRGGSIAESDEALQNIGGTSTIISGTIHANSEDGIYINGGTVVLGNNEDDDVRKDDPIIYGGTYGVYVRTGTFNFFDGIIEGPLDKYKYGAINEIPEGYDIVVTKGEKREIAVLEKLKVVKNSRTNVEYYNFKDAVAEAQKEDTLQVINTMNIMKTVASVVILSDKEITIDINGNTVNCYNENTFINNGTLNICDGKTENPGLIFSNVNAIIKNTGDLNINSGNIVVEILIDGTKVIDNVGNVNLSGGTISTSVKAVIKNYVIYNNGTGKVTMSGGEINMSGFWNYGYSSAYAIYNNYIKEENGLVPTIEMTGGTIKYGKNASNLYGIYNNGDANINIFEMNGGELDFPHCVYIERGNVQLNQGTLKGSTGLYIANYAKAVAEKDFVIDSTSVAINAAYNSRLKINGGRYTGEDYGITGYGNVEILDGEITATDGDAIYISGTVTLGDNKHPVSKTRPVITGSEYGVYNSGTFNFYDGIIKGSTRAISKAPSAVPELHKVEFSEGETVAILAIEATFEQVAIMNGQNFNDLQTAINTATDGAIIVLQKDIALETAVQIPSTKNIKLDLNGNTILNVEGGTVIENNGTLSIGTDDGTMYGNPPRIIGDIAGVENNGTMYMYDGKVIGATPISGTSNVFSVAVGYTYQIVEKVLSLIAN